MAITDAFVLPEDLLILPVSELDEEVRARLHCEEGDFAVTRPRARHPTKVVDARLGALLQRFRTARPILDAIIEFSDANGVDPETLLSDAFPLLQRFIDIGLLVEESSPRARRITATLDVGDRVGEWEVVRCRQMLDDVELYQVRSSSRQLGALKIARRAEEEVADMLEHERDVLEHLEGSPVSPALLEWGHFQDRPYLVMEWRSGVDADTVAGELRDSPTPENMERLLQLCCDVATAYAELHDRGVLHGDVHERNILVDSDGAVCIVDFGLACLTRATGGDRQEQRAGFSVYAEPEYGAAHLAERRPPPCTAAGEQYSIAALLYSLFSGSTCINFSVDLKEAWRQIAEMPVMAFVERGLAPLPALEHVLGRALEKAPERRFGSVREFTQALKSVIVDSRQRLQSSLGAPDESVPQELLEAILAEVSWHGKVFCKGLAAAPTASVNFGAAGLALALYRLALLRNDADLMALADVWATRARQCIGGRRAFYNPRIGIRRDDIGPASLYHTSSGIHLVRALIARAMGDVVSMSETMEAYTRAAGRRCDNADLTLGRSGSLLGSAILLETVPNHPLLDRRPVMALGTRLAGSLLHEMSQLPAPGSGDGLVNLGIAHGWGGQLYAQLRWHTVAGTTVPTAIENRLRELADCAESYGRGLRWPWRDTNRVGHTTHMPGWCNGSAGLLQLWLLASSVYGDAAFMEVARGAAWHTWEDDGEHGLDLCCGLSGRAYSLLAMYRRSGDVEWLRRARILAAMAAEREDDAADVVEDGDTSLYKGRLGPALLSAEIERPEAARMPLFESEGWPVQAMPSFPASEFGSSATRVTTSRQHNGSKPG